ncbi:MAG: sigma-70 family RNA polymerase sigma factor [Polyangiaceae bacterium]
MTESAREPLDALFRRSSAALVATLTRAFGPARLDLVEAVVQDAFVRALQEWDPVPPANPSGWLLSVARNLAVDQIRRERTFASKESEIVHAIESSASAAASRDFAEGGRAVSLAGEIADDHLRMIFVTCHPANTVPSQVVLALRTLCGLDVPAIARALYTTQDAIEKRLVLARRRLREAGVTFDLPPPDELASRLDAVLSVLYLMFNEAYCGTTGPDVVQEDVAVEAIRLASFLAACPRTSAPRVLALLALMHFHASRFPARRDADGHPLALSEQDRSRWDQRHIAAGLRCLSAAATGDSVSRYHCEAAIAALHATSPSFDDTRWPEIVAYYDQLAALSPSARLARAIAVGFRDGPAAALSELDAIQEEAGELSGYHAARGDAYDRLGRTAEARAAYTEARARATSEHERRYYDRRLA